MTRQKSFAQEQAEEAAKDCVRNHTPSPKGYAQKAEWMQRMSRTHTQHKCPGCGLYAIWRPRSL